MKRARLTCFDHIAIVIISTVAWLLMILGAFLCLDAFLPKSHPVSSVWPEFFVGVVVWAVGFVLRIIRRRSF